MEISEILKKVLAGRELSGEERKKLGEFRPQGIPKSRLDAEIVKRKELEKQNLNLNSSLQELNSRIEELENRGLSEQEKLEKNYNSQINSLREQVSSLTAERNSSQEKLDQYNFQRKVNKLAGKKQFNDSDYLGFLLKQANVQLDAPEQVESFMEDLRKSSPKLFHVDLNPGGGSNPGSSNSDYSVAMESGDITAMLANAPSVD